MSDLSDLSDLSDFVRPVGIASFQEAPNIVIKRFH